MRSSTLPILSLSLLTFLTAQAAETEAEHVPEVLQSDVTPHHHSKGHVLPANHKEIHRLLNENAPADMPGNSRFTFVGREHKYYLQIGGYAKATASFDFGNTFGHPNDFVTADIPTRPEPGNGGEVQFSAQQTHLCLNFIVMPGAKDQIGVYIGGNLRGDNYSPELQYAYLNYRGIQAGYNYTPFSDPGAQPSTIDYQGPNASTANQVGMVQYSRSFGPKKAWTVGGGLTAPFYSITDGEESRAVSQRVPDVPVFARYGWNNNTNWVRLSAVLRNMQYRDELLAKNLNKVGWGVQLSGVADLSDNLTAYWMGVYGHGISSYIQDLNGGGMDLLPDPCREGKMDAIQAWGAYGALQYNFSKTVYSTMGYSHVRTYAGRYCGGETAWGDQYRYAQYALANVFWNITPVVQTGVEYLYGRRVNYDASQGHDNRLQCMLQLTF